MTTVHPLRNLTTSGFLFQHFPVFTCILHPTVGRSLPAPIFQTWRVDTGGPVTCPGERAEKARASLFLSIAPSVGGNTSWTSISRRDDLKGKLYKHNDSVMKNPNTFCAVTLACHSRSECMDWVWRFCNHTCFCFCVCNSLVCCKFFCGSSDRRPWTHKQFAGTCFLQH